MAETTEEDGAAKLLQDEELGSVVSSVVSGKEAVALSATLSESPPETAAVLEMQQRVTLTGGSELTSTLEGVDADNVEDEVASMIAHNEVVVFSKTWCPFCSELKRTLVEMGVSFTYVELDKLPNGALIQGHLAAKFNHKTVPQIIVNGTHYGGCDDLKKLQSTGEASKLFRGSKEVLSVEALEKQIWKQPEPEECNRAINAMFAFPAYTNSYVIRGTSIQVVALCILGLIFREKKEMHWVIFGLFVDFCLRVFVGSMCSPLALNAVLLVANKEPDLRPGPPKQFAAFCGVCFSGFTALFFRLGQIEIGCTILAILLFCAIMESTLDFCVGCWFFGKGGEYGIVPKSTYKVYQNTREETLLMWREAFIPLNEGPYGAGIVRGDADLKHASDLKYKSKTEEQKLEDFDVIRHMTLPMFDLPLSCNGAALLCWNLTESQRPFRKVSYEWWQLFALIGVVLFAVMLIKYTLKLLLYPKKVWKEWSNPKFAVSGASVFMNLLLMAFFVSVYNGELGTDKADSRFAQFLWWFASVSLMAFTVWLFTSWLQRPLALEHVDASWLMPVLGTLLSAITAPYVSTATHNLRDVVWFWYSVGFFLFLVLMPISVFRVVAHPLPDCRRRNSLALWVASPSALVLAHRSVRTLQLTSSSSLSTAIAFDEFELVLYFAAIFLTLVMVWSFFVRFVGRAKWGESFYCYGFPLALIAICSLQYIEADTRTDNDGIGNDLSRVLLAYPLIFATLWIVTVNLQHTAIGVVRKHLFRPTFPKWGVLSYMRFTHFAFVNWIKLFTAKCDELEAALKEDDSGSKASKQCIDAVRNQMVAEFNVMALVKREHMRQEDEVLFAEANAYFPGCSQHASEHHFESQRTLATLKKRLSEASQSDASELQALIGDLRAFCEQFSEHMDWEELHLEPVLRKNATQLLEVDMLRRVWAVTPLKHWKVFIPWVLKHQYKYGHRLLWLKCLLWAMPERGQMIGLMASRGIPDYFWAQITRELPELIPRGLAGYRRAL